MTQSSITCIVTNLLTRFQKLRQDLLRLLAFRPQESPVFVPLELDMDHFVNLVCLIYKGCIEQHNTSAGAGYDDTFERLLGYKNTMHHICVYGTRQLSADDDNIAAGVAT